jgi:hypothetical protein
MTQAIQQDYDYDPIDMFDPDIPAPELPIAYIAYQRDGHEVVTCGAPGISAEALAASKGATDWREVDADYVPAQTPDELAAVARAKRDELLAASDWTQLPDSPLSSDVRSAWAAYRQALRDVTGQEGFPGVIVWPVAPGD